VFKCFNIDGFIGSNLLKNSIVQIDFETNRLVITNSKRTLELDKSKSTKMELIGEQRSPFIFIDIKGGRNAKDQVLIDTGMDSFYDISKRSYDIFKNNDILKVLATAKGGNILSLFGNAKETEQHRILMPELNVAGISFLKLVTTSTTDNISRIGTEMLKHGIVTIDFKNKRFYFDAKQQVIDVSRPLPGVSPTFIDNKLVVGYVWDEELKNKINYGDEITKINDHNITGMRNCDFISLKQELEHTDTLHIEFRNKAGENSKLTIVKKIPEM
jgi:predicted aspartyl protease